MTLSKYYKIYRVARSSDPVLFSTKKASVITVAASMLNDIEKEAISEEEQKALTDLGFLVESREEEKEGLSRFIDELNEIDTILAVKIVMNLDCNLACTYCFEGRRKGKFFLKKKTADDLVGFIKYILISKKKEELRVTFYGGEPLLSAELTSYVSGELKEMAESNGIIYTAFIITNGTLLTAKTAERLKAFGLKEAAVTLDGPKHIHDLFRPFKTGNGSFDTIIRNVKDSCGIIRIQLGGNFTRENYREMPGLLDYLLSNGLTPDKIPLVRFDPVMKETEDIAPPDFHDGCDCHNEPWIIEAVSFLRGEILKRGYNSMKVAPIACLLDIKDRMIINYDGSIYKCPGLIGRKEFCVGNIRDGIKDYRHSHNLDNWKNEECLNCAYLPLCFGGCRYMKFIREGNMTGVDCKKPYFDAVLEELVKQDIKYGIIAVDL
jgi:uncharacterized protein